MAVNKYGNDFKNNIMWNQEYPFIPEVTNDDGLVIKENEIYEFYEKNLKKFYPVRVVKIYNKDYIWGHFYNYATVSVIFMLALTAYYHILVVVKLLLILVMK